MAEPSHLGVASALVGGEIVPGDVTIQGDRVEAVGVLPAGRRGLAVPGFVDLQVNGFAGVDFASADAADYATVGAALAATGVSAYQPTLITSDRSSYVEPLRAAAGAAELPGPRLLGMHLEGPFLSPIRHGAHDPDKMIDPDIDLVRSLLAEGPISQMTLAPELPGALEMIEWLVGRGMIAAVGHSNATAEEAHAAFDRGARSVTHLFNAQRPFSHREPAIAGAALDRTDVFVTIIVDGNHLADETVRLVLAAAPGRVALITDAIAAAGRPEGDHPLGDRTVHVTGGRAELADGTPAGSVLTMDRAVRNLVALGATVPTALQAASAVPARLLDRSDLGRIEPGDGADVVVVDDRLEVTRTLVAGRESFSAHP